MYYTAGGSLRREVAEAIVCYISRLVGVPNGDVNGNLGAGTDVDWRSLCDRTRWESRRG